MATTNLRYFQLLQQTEKNPLAKKVAASFDIADDFRRDVERIAADRRLSAEGRRDATLDLSRKAIRDLRDLRKPLDEHHAKTESMRAKVKAPSFDKTDIVAAMARRELRDRSVAMSPGQRAGKLTGPHRSVALLDAVLEFADDPWMSGIDIYDKSQLDVFEIARQERLRDHHGALLDEIDARDAEEVGAHPEQASASHRPWLRY